MILKSALPDASVSLTGTGVHWKCTLAHGSRHSVIHCFDANRPEYLIEFDHEKENRAMGRTSSKTDAIAATRQWLENLELPQLHERFGFIDRQKRLLEAIVNGARDACPELRNIWAEVKHASCDLHELWFREQDRSCRISYYGKNPHPDASFHWDECHLFAFQASDIKVLAQVLKQWLADRVKPSALQVEFPWIEMGKVARYYEEGRGIEGEFVDSWDQIEEFYRRLKEPRATEVLRFIGEIRKVGYDRTLRAGQSMFTLVHSRSRRHGLEHEQPRLAFVFPEQGMNVHARIRGETTLRVPELTITDEVEALLKQLASSAID